ncbi:MAG: hypothetical protein ABI877_19755 [Gemmatimonadaceae bacterium]
MIELAVAGRRQAIREISGMRAADVTRAFRIGEEHGEYLLTDWRRYDG